MAIGAITSLLGGGGSTMADVLKQAEENFAVHMSQTARSEMSENNQKIEQRHQQNKVDTGQS